MRQGHLRARPGTRHGPRAWAAPRTSSRLRRTRVGAFDEAVAVDSQTLREAAEAGDVGAHLRPVEAALDDIPGSQRRTRRCCQPCARPGGAGARARCAGPQRCGVCALQRPHPRARRAGERRLPADPRVQFRLEAQRRRTKQERSVNAAGAESRARFLLARPAGSCIRPATNRDPAGRHPGCGRPSRAKALSHTSTERMPDVDFR